MTARVRTLAMTAATAAVMLAAGCSGGSDDGKEAAKKAAVDYQEAVLGKDWHRVCELKTERMRGGSVAACVELAQTGPSDDGGSKAGDVAVTTAATVEAAGSHPAGIGTVLTYQVDHPDGASETARKALRLVKTGDTWKVDQTTTLHGSNGSDAEALRALLREG